MKFWLFLFFILAFGRLCYWTEPFGVSVDESTYLSIAEVMNRGGVLYVDAIDRKPPGLFWIYQGIESMFGPWNIHALHFSFLVFFLSLSLLLFFLVRGGGASRDAKRAAAFFAVFSACFPREILSANAEVLMLLFLGLSALGLQRSLQKTKNGRSFFWIVAAGVMAGVATFCKQYAILIFFGLAFGFWFDTKRSARNFFKLAGGSLVGGMLVFAGGCFYFWSKNALPEFMEYFLWNGLRYVATSREDANQSVSGLWATGGMILAWLPLWSFAIKGIFPLKKAKVNPQVGLWIGAVIGSLATIYLSGRYYTHYFLPTIWALSPLAAVGFRDLSILWRRVGLGLSVFLFCGFFVFNIARDELGIRSAFTRQRQNQLREVSELVQNETQTNDQIVVWGMASQIYVLSQRGSGTRYIFSDPVSGRLPGLASSVSRPFEGAESLFLQDMAERRPSLVVDTSGAALNDYGAFPFSRFPNVAAFVEKHYRRGPSLHGFDLWILKNER